MASRLTLVPLKEIMTELTGRFDDIVIIGRKDLDVETTITSKTSIVRKYHGDLHVCLGLCVDMKDAILCDMSEKILRIDPEDG